MKDILCQCGDIIQPNDDALCGACALEFYANKRKIESLKREIATLKEALESSQADNRSLVEQMNAMALKPNQEVIDWHSYIEKKPEKTGYYIIYYTILNRVAFDFWHNDKQEWDKYGEYILAWAYLPKGVTNDIHIRHNR